MGFNRTWFLKHADATVGAVACRILGALNYLARRGVPLTETDMGTVKRVLVIRPGGMGDLIILLPLLRHIIRQFPGAAVDLICERRNLEVPGVAGLHLTVLPYDKQPLRLLCHLVRTRYDLAIDTEQFHNFSAVFALISGARWRIGFKINPLRNPLYTHLVNYAPDGNEGDQFNSLLAPTGSATEPYDLAGAIARDQVVALPDNVLATWPRSKTGCESAVFHLGSSTRYKQWAPERFAELATRLHTQYGTPAVLVGSGGDRAAADRVQTLLEDAGVSVLSLVGQLSLAQSAAAIARASLFVGPDSGLAHMAVALDTPTAVLFGPSDPLKWGTRTSHHAVVHVPLPCSPCFIFGFSKPCRTIDCMRRITVDMVFTACAGAITAPRAG